MHRPRHLKLVSSEQPDHKSIEHRWFPRTDLELPVNVIPGGLPSALGRTANIGLGGMFVHMNGDHLQANDLVSVLIYLGPRCYQTRAFVTRVTPRGVALMFAHLDRNTLELLLVLETGDSQFALDSRQA